MKNPFKNNIFFHTTYFLSALLAYQIYLDNSFENLAYIGSIIGVGLVTEFVSSKIFKTRVSFIGALITSLIICLITFKGWLDAVYFSNIAVVASGILLKNLFQKLKFHFFNPAALGGVVVIVLSLFGILEPPLFSWHGVDFRINDIEVSLILVALFGAYAVFKLRKMFFTVSFLLSFLILQYLVGGTEAIANYFYTSTLYFYLTIMLLEPKTSIMMRYKQMICGVVIAGFLTALLFYSVEAPYILSIFVLNLILLGVKLSKKVIKKLA